MTTYGIHPKLPAPNKGGQRGTFCTFCGLPLVERMVPNGFDDRTGKPRYEWRKDCPRLVSGELR